MDQLVTDCFNKNLADLYSEVFAEVSVFCKQTPNQNGFPTCCGQPEKSAKIQICFTHPGSAMMAESFVGLCYSISRAA
ncbi:MAG: hypothetical protein IPJ38_22455 [Dechloromonas sp.]|uniref:Uncharacterized protein n=1 Tax=Candidatus Dechloromonas phosphorivorans TaxID=2899244 RepID=A0A935MSS4_9RHOO|nr:hypothetical protein [Candidatus Dechloromonas phosphorivorans]